MTILERSGFAAFLWLLVIFANGANSEQSNDDSTSKITVCADTPIAVQYVGVLCDSPGTYYYGGPRYRKSETCQPGDKAWLTIDFDIVEDIEDIVEDIEDFDVFVSVTASGADDSVTVYNEASLCSLGSLKKYGNTCPQQGSYTISTHFNFTRDYYDSDSSVSFYPYISVGFKSTRDMETFDLGGANTTFCETVTETVDNVRSSALATILLSTGIVVGIIVIALGLFAFYWSSRNNKTNAWVDGDEETVIEKDKKIHLLGKDTGLF